MKFGKHSKQVKQRAWAIHCANGHPKGYDGPCWGATEDEVKQAMEELNGVDESVS